MIYTLGTDPVNNPNTDTKLAVAWGQDPTTATAGAPGLDVGTSVPPMPEFQAGKDGTLYDDPSTLTEIEGDNDDDGVLSAGDEMVYPITVYNVSRLPVPNVYVWDHAPDPTLYDTTYVEDSTVIRKDTDGDGTWDSTTAIADDATGTPFPLDNDNGTDPDGYNAGTLPVSGIFEVTFHVILDEYDDLIDGAEAILNGGQATALGWDDPVDDKAFLKGRISDYVWYDTDGDGVQDAGEQPIQGVVVRLLDSAGQQMYGPSGILEMQTDAAGKYLFTGLPAASYIVQFVAPEGTEFTTRDVGADTLDSDANTTAGTDYGKTALITLGGGQKYYDADAGLGLITPTLAVVGSFGANLMDGKVVVNWTTISEVDTAGFYLERFDPAGKQWLPVNQALVPALLESSSGGTYALVDDGSQAKKTTTYRLVEVETSGSTVVHGPYTVKAEKTQPAGQAQKELARGAKQVRVPKVALKALAKTLTASSFVPGGSTGVFSRQADRLRISVTDAGLYKVEVSDLVTGLRLTTDRAKQLIRTGGVALTSGGVNVAYLPASDGSALYFYGKAIESVYSNVNIYWLKVGEGTLIVEPEVVTGSLDLTAETTTSTATTVAPTSTTETTVTEEGTSTTERAPEDQAGGLELAVEETSSTETTSPPEVLVAVTASFVDVIHAERDVMGMPALFEDPEADFWLWDYLVAGHDPLMTKTFTVDAPGAVNGIELSVHLQGVVTTDMPGEHHVRVKLNGVQLGETSFTGAIVHDVSLAIPSGLLVEGANSVELTALLDSGIAYSLVAVDSLDVSYERSLRVVDDELRFSPAVDGLAEVAGLSSSSAWVLDISEPELPTAMQVTATGGEAGNTWLRFEASAGRSYVVATSSAASRPNAVAAVTGTTLRAANKGADYVVITSPELAGAAGRLAAYRAQDKLRAIVVTTTEIYDEFNHGVASPLAIKSFIEYATTTWMPVARFVVLVGEGSYDYKNNSGNGDCLVPTVMVGTGHGLFVSDVALADSQGADGVPEAAIGRIPALTNAELDGYLAKLKAYEASSIRVPRKVLLTADNADHAGEFAAQSDAIASLLPKTVKVSKAYFDGTNLAAVRSALLPSFSDGTLLVNYVGHGGFDQLAEEGILSVADVPLLKTGNTPPVVTAYTCVAGQFGLPGADSLSEILAMRAKAGAMAVWAPISLQEAGASARLAGLFTKNLFAGSHTVRLGTVIQTSLKAGAAEGLPVELLNTYGLAGDPALKVRW